MCVCLYELYWISFASCLCKLDEISRDSRKVERREENEVGSSRPCFNWRNTKSNKFSLWTYDSLLMSIAHGNHQECGDERKRSSISFLVPKTIAVDMHVNNKRGNERRGDPHACDSELHSMVETKQRAASNGCARHSVRCQARANYATSNVE